MRLHWLQHVPFEGLGCIEPWLIENDHEISCTRLWADEKVPDIGLPSEAARPSKPWRSRLAKEGKVDGLIVMGGPMSIADDDKYPWLAAEKAFIKEIIDQDKPVLGICLGAQLIADVLGAEVRPAKNKEIGIFPVFGNENLKPDAVGSNVWNFPEGFLAFHWHGDTFGIPNGATHLASSEACENQAFVYNNKVLALQFHLETTEESLLALYENCSDEIGEGPFIQSLEKATALRLAEGDLLRTCNDQMRGLLKQLF